MIVDSTLQQLGIRLELPNDKGYDVNRYYFLIKELADNVLMQILEQWKAQKVKLSNKQISYLKHETFKLKIYTMK